MAKTIFSMEIASSWDSDTLWTIVIRDVVGDDAESPPWKKEHDHAVITDANIPAGVKTWLNARLAQMRTDHGAE